MLGDEHRWCVSLPVRDSFHLALSLRAEFSFSSRRLPLGCTAVQLQLCGSDVTHEAEMVEDGSYLLFIVLFLLCLLQKPTAGAFAGQILSGQKLSGSYWRAVRLFSLFPFFTFNRTINSQAVSFFFFLTIFTLVPVLWLITSISNLFTDSPVGKTTKQSELCRQISKCGRHLAS